MKKKERTKRDIVGVKERGTNKEEKESKQIKIKVKRRDLERTRILSEDNKFFFKKSERNPPQTIIKFLLNNVSGNYANAMN